MGNFKENLSRNCELSWRDFNENSLKMRTSVFGDVLEQVFKIAVAYTLYFFLLLLMKLDTTDSGFVMKHLKDLWNYVMVNVILGTYWSLLHGMVVSAIKAAVLPSAAYAFFCVLYYKYPKLRWLSPIIAYIAIALLIYNLLDNLVGGMPKGDFKSPELPSVWDLKDLKGYASGLYDSCRNWFSVTWNSIVKWAMDFFLTCSMAVIFALHFHSKEFGTKVAMGVIFIMNAATFVSLGVIGAILGAIPIVSGPSDYIISAIRLCFNFIIISDLFIVIAVGNLSKLAIDYVFYRCTLSLPDSDYEQPAQVFLPGDSSTGYAVQPLSEAGAVNVELIPVGASAGSEPVRLSVTDSITLGRDTGGSGVDINGDGSISRSHCEMAFTQGSLFVRDLGSTNGTKLNGIAAHEFVPVKDGDNLVLGNAEFSVRIIEPPKSAEQSMFYEFSSNERTDGILSGPLLKYAAAGLAGIAVIFAGYYILTQIIFTSDIDIFKSETELAVKYFNRQEFEEAQKHLNNALDTYKKNEKDDEFKKAIHVEASTWVALHGWYKSPGLKVTAWYFDEKSAWRKHFDGIGEVAPDPLFVVLDKDGNQLYKELLGTDVKSPCYVSSKEFRLLRSGNKIIFKDENPLLDAEIAKYGIDDMLKFYGSLTSREGNIRKWREAVLDKEGQTICHIGFDVTYPTAEELVENFSK